MYGGWGKDRQVGERKRVRENRGWGMDGPPSPYDPKKKKRGFSSPRRCRHSCLAQGLFSSYLNRCYEARGLAGAWRRAPCLDRAHCLDETRSARMDRIRGRELKAVPACGRHS